MRREAQDASLLEVCKRPTSRQPRNLDARGRVHRDRGQSRRPAPLQPHTPIAPSHHLRVHIGHDVAIRPTRHLVVVDSRGDGARGRTLLDPSDSRGRWSRVDRAQTQGAPVLRHRAEHPGVLRCIRRELAWNLMLDGWSFRGGSEIDIARASQARPPPTRRSPPSDHIRIGSAIIRSNLAHKITNTIHNTTNNTT